MWSDHEKELLVVALLKLVAQGLNSDNRFRAGSGVGFNNNGDHKIDFEDDQWDQIIDPDAKFMRNKSWPLWEHWQVIFGKDMAGGEGAEDMHDAAFVAKSQQVNNLQAPSMITIQCLRILSRKITHSQLGLLINLTKAQILALSKAERYELCDILGDKPQRLECFMGLQDEDKYDYLVRLINLNQRAI
ncbi:hypothetical protein AAHA92_18152 [Salvia divinorum]|uniref:Uncharacterized protein n=1 Tax=Salvia divinorum TaxID=28513 RepID=A0ABD1H160_SALDI